MLYEQWNSTELHSKYRAHSSTIEDGVQWHHAFTRMNMMPQCICNALCHCMSIPCHICNTCHMDNLSCIMNSYIKAYNFQTIHLNVYILEFIYQHSINNHPQSSQSKAFKDNLVLTTNCCISDAHKAVHTYSHHRPHKHAILRPCIWPHTAMRQS